MSVKAATGKYKQNMLEVQSPYETWNEQKYLRDSLYSRWSNSSDVGFI